MTPEEVLALLQVIARLQAQVNRLESALTQSPQAAQREGG